MAEKRLYTYDGKQFTGESVEIESSSEPFAQIVLADGTKVKVKLILLDAIRLDTHNDQGDPVYQFQFQQIIGIVAPDNLKRKPQ